MAKKGFFKLNKANKANRVKYTLLLSVFLVAFMSTFMSLMPSFEAAVWKSCCASGCDYTWCQTLTSGSTTWYCCESAVGWAASCSDVCVCIRANPSVSISPSSQSGVKGTKLDYTVTVTNNDNSLCTSSTFGLTSTCPSGWTCSLSPPSLNIASGGSSYGTSTFSVTSSTSATDGTYTISVKATNNGATSYSDTKPATYTVSSCSGTLDVSITGTDTCTVAESFTATGCDGKAFQIKDDGTTKCSGTVSGGTGTCTTGSSSWTVGVGSYTYNLYIDGALKSTDSGNTCPSSGLVLALSPNPVCQLSSVTPTASDVPLSYNGYTINFRSGSCTGSSVSSCTSNNGGCEGPSFTSPSAAGTYPYFATMDKNNNGDVSDAGECGQENLDVTACGGCTHACVEDPDNTYVGGSFDTNSYKTGTRTKEQQLDCTYTYQEDSCSVVIADTFTKMVERYDNSPPQLSCQSTTVDCSATFTDYACFAKCPSSSYACCAFNQPPTCSIYTIGLISCGTTYNEYDGTSKTLWYNNIGSPTCDFTVFSDVSDDLHIGKIVFPDTVSAGTTYTEPISSYAYQESSRVKNKQYNHKYSWDASDTFSSAATITAYDVKDKTGTCSFNLIRDIIAPTTTASITLRTTGSYDIELPCTDNSGGSGCKLTKYCTDTTNTCDPSSGTTYSGKFIKSCSGCCYVRYYSTDNVNNIESVKSASFGPTCKTISASANPSSINTGQTSTITASTNPSTSGLSISCSVTSGSGSISGSPCTTGAGGSCTVTYNAPSTATTATITCSATGWTSGSTTVNVISIPTCTLTSATITPINCDGGTYRGCEPGEQISVFALYYGDCSAGNLLQIDAKSADGLCDVKYTGGDVSGVWSSSLTNVPPSCYNIEGDQVCDSGFIYGYWTVPSSIPVDCKGQTVTATAAGLYIGNPVGGTQIGFIQPASGSFDFFASATCSVTSISESSSYAYSSGTTAWYNPVSTGSFTVNAYATSDRKGLAGPICYIYFPPTVSNGCTVFATPAVLTCNVKTDLSGSCTYNFDSTDTYSDTATVQTENAYGDDGTCQFIVTRDATAPTTSASITGSYTITLSCADNSGGAGCSQTTYCTDSTNTCTPTTTYSAPFTTSCSGCCYVRYNSTDRVNNRESTKSTSFGPTCGTYTATFSQSGIPSGTTWGVTVGGTRYTSTTSSLTVSSLSGTVAYTYDATVSGAAGTRYSCNAGCSGSVTSSSNSASATYITQYQLTMAVSPLGSGTTTPAVGSYWYNSGASVSISASAGSGYTWSSWSGSGTGSYTGTANPSKVLMKGDITETANFAPIVGTCSALSYPSDRWQRVWYVHSSGSCLGDTPDEPNAQFDNNWASGAVAYSRSDDIEFRSSRTINLPATGTYTFTLGSDDGSRLYVDGILRIDRWYDTGYSTTSQTVSLTAGNHQFEIDFYENGGDARVSFAYTAPAVCSGTDTSCGTYPSCTNCNSQDGTYCTSDWESTEIRNYYCISNAAGCGYTTSGTTDCGTEYYQCCNSNRGTQYVNYYCTGGPGAACVGPDPQTCNNCAGTAGSCYCSGGSCVSCSAGYSCQGYACCKSNGASCSASSECCSGNCKADYDGSGSWCADATQCVHNAATYNNGANAPDCYDACTRRYCNSGTWSTADCGSYTCSGGSCSSTCSQSCGATCDENADCSSGFICNPSCSCISCKTSGQTCSAVGDCCSSYTSGTTCYYSPSCSGTCSFSSCPLADSCGTNTLTVGKTCSASGCSAGTTYTCSAASHTNCQSQSCGGSARYCTYDGSTWAWRASYPAEVCNDGTDNDCDGSTDSSDSNCCNLQTASITANCAGGSSSNCEQGETITMSGTYAGACSAADFFQIDAVGGTCAIQYTGGDMQGIYDASITVSGGTISNAVWTIPSIAADCYGKTVSATASALYDGGGPGTGTGMDGAESVSGSFTFASAPSVCSGSITLSLSPNPVQTSGSVTPSASGLSSCSGKTVSFRRDSCAGTQVSSCAVDGGSGCTGAAFTAPSTASTYTYYACVDKNSNGDYADSGESDPETLTVQSAPACSRDGLWGDGHEYKCDIDKTKLRCKADGSGYDDTNLCDSTNCGAYTSCNNLQPDYQFQSCGALATYYWDRCSSNCGIEDYPSVCKAPPDLDCTAGAACDEKTVGTSCGSDMICDSACNCIEVGTSCNLILADIGASCAGGSSSNCEQGESIIMWGAYSGDCSAADFFQIDAVGNGCNIQYSGGSMRGISDPTIGISGGSINGRWFIPEVAAECVGKTVSATASALYDGGGPGTGTQLDLAESVSGSFTFAIAPVDNPPSCSVSSITESSTYAYSSGTTVWYSTASTGSFTVNVAASDDKGVSSVSFPLTVSTGGSDTTSPYSYTYNWLTTSTFSSSAIVTAYDAANNQGTCTFTVTRDVTAPTTSTSITGSYTITLTCSDASSGCSQTTYCTDDATNDCNPTTTYSAPVATSCSSCCYVRYNSTDSVSNKEDIKSASFGPTCGCVRANPAVSITPSPQSGTGGSTLTYTVTVTNNDNSACGFSLFDLSSSCPADWPTCSLSPAGLTIAPAASGTSTFTVASSASASEGDYSVSAIATNNGASSYTRTNSATYKVTGGGVAFTFSIYKGWNMISLPYANVMGVAEDTCDATNGNFYYYDVTTGKWNVDIAGIMNLATGKGYWFYSSKSCTIKISGSGTVTSSNIPIKPGWNQIASPTAGMTDAHTIKSNCASCTGGSCGTIKILWYDPVSMTWREVSNLEPGKGYQAQCVN